MLGRVISEWACGNGDQRPRPETTEQGMAEYHGRLRFDINGKIEKWHPGEETRIENEKKHEIGE
jgi:hypothetical protein